MEVTLSFFESIIPQLVLIGVFYIATFFLVICDLVAGIRKAKRAGEFSSSYGYTKTKLKLKDNFNLLAVASVVDVVLMFSVLLINQHKTFNIPVFPLIDLCVFVIFGFIEIKSVFESYEKKQQARMAEAARFGVKAIKDRDLLGAIDKMIDIAKKFDDKDHGNKSKANNLDELNEP